MSRSLSSPRLLFVGCFIALITTSFGFLLRVLLMEGWAKEFNLSATQQGELFGVGLWPFAISIVLLSLFIDRIGYKPAMVFGFLCHLASLVMTITAKDYEGLYWANFVVALGNGTVEAYINPVVATQFRNDKARWLNILHAGWPGGMVIAGLIVLSMGGLHWHLKMLLLAVPAVAYFAILIVQEFPLNERVAAGVSYRTMLGEVGAAGAFIITWLVTVELARSAFGAQSPMLVGTVVAVLVALAAFALVRTFGRPLFILLLLVMVPLATTELGVDSWVSQLLGPAMEKAGFHGIHILIYTAALMMVLRFFAGPLLHRLSPVGMLALCSGVAAAGLFALAGATTVAGIFACATIYAVGKTFFWPTMLGVVAEQFPKGGALTLNATGGVGMLGVGVLGAMLMGNFQDRAMDRTLLAQDAAIHSKIMVEKQGLLGTYQAVDEARVQALPVEQQAVVSTVGEQAKRSALRAIVVLPLLMLGFFVSLALWFRYKGGYRPVTAG